MNEPLKAPLHSPPPDLAAYQKPNPPESKTPLPSSLEDEANKAIVCLYICVDSQIADDVKHRVGAFVCQLKRERDEALAKLEHAQSANGLIDVLNERDQLRDQLSEYDKAADKFIAKCANGQARSVETLRDLMLCRNRSTAMKGGNQ